MMKILMLLDNDFTMDARVYREATALVGAGHEVQLMACISKKPDIPRREDIQGIQVHRVLTLQDFDYHLPRRWVRVFRKALTCLKHCPKPDVVHAHDVYTLPMAWLMCRLTGAKLLYDSHEDWQATLGHLLQKTKALSVQAPDRTHRKKYLRAIQDYQFLLWAESRLINTSDAVITVSAGIAERLSAYRQPAQPTPVVVRNTAHYLPNASLLAQEKRYHQQFQLPADQRVILYQGVVKPGRGLQPLVNVMANHAKAFNAALVLMGPLYQEAFLQDMLKHVPRNTVYYLPPVPPHEVDAWTASANLGVIASPRWHQNSTFSLPNKFFSYIQAEVPMLVNTLPEMGHLLAQYPVGVMTDMGDESAIAKSLKDLLDDSHPGRLAEFQSALKHAKGVLSWEQEQQSLLNLYRCFQPERSPGKEWAYAR